MSYSELGKALGQSNFFAERDTIEQAFSEIPSGSGAAFMIVHNTFINKLLEEYHVIPKDVSNVCSAPQETLDSLNDPTFKDLLKSHYPELM